MRGNDTEHSREVNKRAVHIEKKKRKAKKSVSHAHTFSFESQFALDVRAAFHSV